MLIRLVPFTFTRIKTKMNKVTYKTAVSLLREGFIGVVPTDTLYGLIAVTDSEDAVERVYNLKRRESCKPCIILTDSVERVYSFGISLEKKELSILEELWPGPNSVIIEVKKAPKYLTRSTGTLAFRVPNDEDLRDFLKETGPVVAPSANLENMKPAASIKEAYLYFGEEVFYVDGGDRTGPASRLMRIEDDKIKVIR